MVVIIQEKETKQIGLNNVLTKSLFTHYTLRGHGCGIYSELIYAESKAMKRAHSKLCNCFSNAVIGINQPIEIRNRDRAKYIQ